MDHLGCYGHPRSISPRLDEFAEEAALFERTVSTAPWTVPSFVSILTGKYVSYHSVGPVNGHRAMSSEEPTIARALSERGYRTAAFVSNYLLRRRMNMHGGFDTYDDTYTSEELRRGMPERTADSVNEFVTNWLDSQGRREPFFLWVHYQDPHGPYTPPERFRSKFPDVDLESDPEKLEITTNEGHHGIPTYQFLEPDTSIGRYRALYEAEVAFADEKIGELMDRLKALGLWKDALVVFTADHGEALGEHDYWFCHGHDVTDDLIRVPLIVKLPGAPRPRRIDELVSTVDVTPTCLEVAGAADRLPVNGASLVDLIEGRTESLNREFVFSEDGQGRVSLRTKETKFIFAPDGERLFDLVADPGETDSLLGRTPEAALGWRQKIIRYRADAKPIQGEDLDQSARELERLRSLGYID
jgi:arylsulfatase A-like enzyme